MKWTLLTRQPEPNQPTIHFLTYGITYFKEINRVLSHDITGAILVLQH